tara:strand:- start:91471 stop:93342 length:1872 start_codon:yes stop_codon:yes gene_type:complete
MKFGLKFLLGLVLFLFTQLCFATEGSIVQRVTVYSQPGWDYTSFTNLKRRYADSPEVLGFLPEIKGWAVPGDKVTILSTTDPKVVRESVVQQFYQVEVFRKDTRASFIGFVPESVVQISTPYSRPETESANGGSSSPDGETADEPRQPKGEIDIAIQSPNEQIPSSNDLAEFQQSVVACQEKPPWVEDGESCNEWALHEQPEVVESLQALCNVIGCGENTSLSSLRDSINQLKGEFYSVPIQCVNMSMLKGKHLRKHNRIHCQKGVVGKNVVPCVTAELVQYTHLAFSKALECIGSDGVAVEPMEFFKIINHESTFHYNIFYRGGVGVAQLTSVAARDLGVGPNGAPRPALKEWNNVKGNPECSAFKNLVSEEGPDLTVSGRVRKCQFLDVDEGIMRSFINGLAVYKSYLNAIPKEMDASWFASEQERQRAILHATRVSYNRGINAWRNAHESMGKPSSPFASADEYTKILESITHEHVIKEERRRLERKKSDPDYIEKYLSQLDGYAYSTKTDQDYSDINKRIVMQGFLQRWDEKLAGVSTMDLTSHQREKLLSLLTDLRRYGSDRVRTEKNFLRVHTLPREYGIPSDELDNLLEMANEWNDTEKIFRTTPSEDLPDHLKPC